LALLVEDLPGRSLPSFAVNRRAAHLATYAVATVLLVCLWMADVAARDPLIVGDSEFPWPAFPIVLWGTLLARSARHRRRPPLLES
jgi:hypothetical protein